ncbi:bifunctional proline dehydrogenase/L-glutamate gamma-semialdehyde dehydrogenase PutA [Roseibium aestuarii]|uniref:Bifunctional protein PutA n=1 Tax=Roseibium aestuarii TaxID=2600299 RepID=A0ABW4JQU1_9HYPH|nr:bifunctional proline dehydrogenase/L-glutamate gamma-semialdehyde dehydrogenase PutA [Roseibium aestuarii]
MRAARDTFDAIDALKLTDETALLRQLAAQANLTASDRSAIVGAAADLVRRIRKDDSLGLMEVFLAEYGLSTEEGIALMCLAEALLRVPDAATIDDLIEDKIVPHDWSAHRGHSRSALVNSSTIGLALTSKVLDGEKPGLTGIVRGAVKRLGEPVIRAAVAQGMREMGRQFVLGETIQKAMERATRQEAKGFTYSYDMLGEAAMTRAAAEFYKKSYSDTIAALTPACTRPDMRDNPGVSVKLSALHPRYEVAQEERVLAELVPVLRDLALQAKAANMNLNVDAEEADRLVLSLQVMERVLEDEGLAGWDGFGVVVQAYSRRAGAVLDWLHETATRLDRRITVRLVKGAYWDAEVKHAQVEGLPDFPVFTRKAYSDVSYIANARKLLAMTDRIYPQFATHNAHTMAAVLHLARDLPKDCFEFQRLHGMGEKLHEFVKGDNGTRCRIYAPVGAHRDLLAYLVRRLLENGANSSFVNQIVDERIAPEKVVACPLTEAEALGFQPSPILAKGPGLFGAARRNSQGHDLSSRITLAEVDEARRRTRPDLALSSIAGRLSGTVTASAHNPATGATIGTVKIASPEDVDAALAAARPWDAPVEERARILNAAADLYEAETATFFALLAAEAGKTLADCVGEVREAVDFLRYYAANAADHEPAAPQGIFTCISPWNFPLAIFSGQIAAALAAGNGVLAKPAEQTPLIATHAVSLLHRAGVPAQALQLLIGSGATVGAALTSDPRVNGVAFTGSTATAQRIRRAMAANMAPDAPLIAETGGLNAMIVDSTALPEQAARDVVSSAFQSAGQRCSALRCLYVQEDIAPAFIEMLQGVMDELVLGDPALLTTDIGPVIDDAAAKTIRDHIAVARAEGRLVKQLDAPATGTFVGPALIRVSGIADLKREIFGPVLHVATFRAEQLDDVVAAINATGYGLTFGLHTRITSRVKAVSEKMHVGNVYVNRNQIGAIVGSQPFGGEGLSGTGPKAGGPAYLSRFKAHPVESGLAEMTAASDRAADLVELRKLLATADAERPVISEDLPGPTGESNRLSRIARKPVLCLGPGEAAANRQRDLIVAMGGNAVAEGGRLAPQDLIGLDGFSAVVWWGDETQARAYAQALSERDGPILPLIAGQPDTGHIFHERHVCIDTTAAGGNAALLAQSAQIAGKA